jgi:ArsR family transcriptional regulator
MMSDKKTVATLERLCTLRSLNKDNADSYISDLRKIANEIDKVELRRSSNFFKALGDESRLRTLHLLEKRDMCVCELVAALESTQPTLSHHLKILETVGLVERKKKGKWAFYGIRKPETPNYIKNAPL